jgi:hypothetical protein
MLSPGPVLVGPELDPPGWLTVLPMPPEHRPGSPQALQMRIDPTTNVANALSSFIAHSRQGSRRARVLAPGCSNQQGYQV